MGSRRAFELHAQARLGRHPDNDLQILDAGVSKFHARIWRDADDQPWVEDLGSQNGSFLNDFPLHAAQRFHLGDVLWIGDTQLALEAVPDFVGQGASLSMRPTQAPVATEVLASLQVREEPFPEAGAFTDPQAFAQAYKDLRATYQLLRAVASAEDLSDLSEAIVDAMLRQLGFDCGALMLLDEDDGGPRLAPLAVRGRDPKQIGPIDIPDDVVQRIRREQNALLSHSLGLTALTAPLVVDAQVLGLLHLVTRKARPDLSGRDLELLSTVIKPAALAIANARLMHRVGEDARERQTLERFLSPALVQQVRQGDVSLERRGQIKNATILFADIRGFVQLTQNLDAVSVVHMLNGYFECGVEVVFAHHGMLDKYIGDAMMAVWGVTDSAGDHTRQALEAALDLQLALKQFNAQRKQRGEPSIQVGIGLASGDVVAGLVGAFQRQEFTVVGDAVNLAARLCDLAGPGQILAPDALRLATAQQFSWRDLGEKMVKGKPRPVRLTELVARGVNDPQ